MIRLLVSRSSGSGTGSVPVGSGAAIGTVRIRPGLPAEPLAVPAVRFRLTVELRRLHAVVDAGHERDDDGRCHHDPGEDEQDEVHHGRDEVGRGKRSRKSPIATVWSTVLIFPPREAGMTMMRIMKNRSTVMPNSRTRMITGTHQGSSTMTARPMSAAAMSDLSAM